MKITTPEDNARRAHGPHLDRCRREIYSSQDQYGEVFIREVAESLLFARNFSADLSDMPDTREYIEYPPLGPESLAPLSLRPLERVAQVIGAVGLPVAGIAVAEVTSNGGFTEDLLGMSVGIGLAYLQRFTAERRDVRRVIKQLNSLDETFGNEAIQLPKRENALMPQDEVFWDESVTSTIDGIESSRTRYHVLSKLKGVADWSLISYARYGQPVTNVEHTINPALFVRSCIERSLDVNKLWEYILPELLDLQQNISDYDRITHELSARKRLQEHAGLVSSELRADVQALEDKRCESQNKQLASYIKIAAIHTRVNEIEEFAVMKNVLVDTIQSSEKAEAQGEGLWLINTAFDAFLRHMPVDSEESTRLGKELSDYLKASMEFLTPTASNLGTHQRRAS